VLHRIDAHIPAGQQIALIGETGSGKTTLGRLIARLADPVGGEIRLGDIPLTQVDNSELRRRLVVVAQEPFLFDDTIAANVRFASPDADDASIDRIVEQLDIADWVRSLPNVLVLDEATSSVDALTEVRISRALGRLSAGRTTIAIAHRLSTAARADRVLVLDGGRLIEDGHHDELVAAGGHYARLYEGWLSSTERVESSLDGLDRDEKVGRGSVPRARCRQARRHVVRVEVGALGIEVRDRQR
jgi:putative ABC transport system ATP-binding protein